jgi:hypothetical protein
MTDIELIKMMVCIFLGLVLIVLFIISFRIAFLVDQPDNDISDAEFWSRVDQVHRGKRVKRKKSYTLIGYLGGMVVVALAIYGLCYEELFTFYDFIFGVK